MGNFLKLWMIVALAAIPVAAGAQDIRINPVPPHVTPKWTPVPGVPQVSWAPNLPTDVFRYRGKYYFFWENYFYQSAAPEGPWKSVVKVPEVFYNVDPAYFKTAKKTQETPVAPGGATPSPKAKIIEVPPAGPPAQAPAAPKPAPPASPAAPGAPEKPPKVM
jgi:hypothetical protein